MFQKKPEWMLCRITERWTRPEGHMTRRGGGGEAGYQTPDIKRPLSQSLANTCRVDRPARRKTHVCVCARAHVRELS